MLVDACCAGIELLNLWLPLDDRVVLQPLALMNTSTLDAADQVRAALLVDFQTAMLTMLQHRPF